MSGKNALGRLVKRLDAKHASTLLEMIFARWLIATRGEGGA